MVNRKKIGRKFEKFCFEKLKEYFDEVIWLSEKNKSTYDFKCVKDGKIYFGDAKVCNQNQKPYLTLKQKDADFVIAKFTNGIELIYKKDFDKKIILQKNYTKTITVKDETWARLTNLKLSLKKYTLDEIIQILIKERDKKK